MQSIKGGKLSNLGLLSVNELDVARTYFHNEFDDLQKMDDFIRISISLLDKNKILRIGCRIGFGNYSYDKSHRIILPNKHSLTYLFFLGEHARLGHAGAQELLASFRDHYKPIRGRNLCKLIKRECLICFRNKPKMFEQLMGNLPKARITPNPPLKQVSIMRA